LYLETFLDGVDLSGGGGGSTNVTNIINQSTNNFTIKNTLMIAPNETLVVDRLSPNSFICLDYLVAFEMPAENAVQTLKMFVGQDDGVYEEQVYAISGHDLCILKTTQITAGVYELVFTNQEAHPVTLTFLRTLI